ncbi:nitrate reductase cytochrome c-type subunit [Shewanella loihica]|uniref:Periplasmic nitrate reductase, electron transfer subunit n=1 Tax=Shewanella loihica (strain ATCC BAA-1088 / PV-4) TaxID=323850 RepID=A3QDT9_SHELP|nr:MULTISPECIES: nitrate reductase cytochrome c-type subunit [Shewanella]ABO23637.1 periplasmic nitrate reductase subunit NapB [Shewanella loihica PV-4]QYJ84099.1 nitrate reductase cytochrome c-type subunit [Shewanella aegiceratis]QYJ95500.1 nitrate reductase cytochrome c-type subunit [Shewanella spartinae]QYJ99304.1 nitrate reductase cytochrome c-type subunit [Shewanella alkalitolerans]QYK14612.1 nitrate reductase cytochrome c-type subunit [Shewanella rhizosphaerae]
MKSLKLVTLATLVTLSVGATFSSVAASVPDEKVATLRQAPLDTNPTPPVMQKVRNTDVKQVRNYPMQPPVIPHKIDGYQIDLKVNKCMSCHARKRVGDSQAPMVSVTHYMDRENNFLADLSPRRYFCTQCHVPQLDAKTLVGNDFIDIDHLIKAEAAKH